MDRHRPLIEYLLNERAERTDITIRIVGTGAKLADKARESEKGTNTLTRRPHPRDCTPMHKTPPRKPANQKTH